MGQRTSPPAQTLVKIDWESPPIRFSSLVRSANVALPLARIAVTGRTGGGNLCRHLFCLSRR